MSRHIVRVGGRSEPGDTVPLGPKTGYDATLLGKTTLKSAAEAKEYSDNLAKYNVYLQNQENAATAQKATLEASAAKAQADIDAMVQEEWSNIGTVVRTEEGGPGVYLYKDPKKGKYTQKSFTQAQQNTNKYLEDVEAGVAELDTYVQNLKENTNVVAKKITEVGAFSFKPQRVTKQPSFGVTDPRTGKQAVFWDKTDAEKYRDTLSTELQAEARPGQMREFAYVQAQRHATMERLRSSPQQMAMAQLKIDGLVTLTDQENEYRLTKKPQIMTDKEMALARQAGFDVGKDLPPGLSWKLYQWGEEAFKDGSDWRNKDVTDRNLVDFAKAETEYYSAVLGSGAKALAAPFRWLYKTITGADAQKVKNVTSSNIKYLEDLSPQQQISLYVGGAGASYLGSYVSMLPVGMATSGIVKSISSITKDSTKVATMINTIRRHPTLTKALLCAPLVGMEYKAVWKMHDAGMSDADIMGEMAMRAGTIIGGTTGFRDGYRAFTKIMNMDISLEMKRVKLRDYMKKTSRGTVPRTQTRQELVPPGQTPGPTTPFLDTSRILGDHSKMMNYHASRARAMLSLDAYTPAELKELKKLKGIPLELWMAAHFPSIWVEEEPFKEVTPELFSAYLATQHDLSVPQIEVIMGVLSVEDLRNTQIMDPISIALLDSGFDVPQLELTDLKVPLVDSYGIDLDIVTDTTIQDIEDIGDIDEIPIPVIPMDIIPIEPLPDIVIPKDRRLPKRDVRDRGKGIGLAKLKIRKQTPKEKEARRIKPTKKSQTFYVYFQYATGASEREIVESKSWRSALVTANRNRKIRLIPLETTIEKRG